MWQPFKLHNLLCPPSTSCGFSLCKFVRIRFVAMVQPVTPFLLCGWSIGNGGVINVGSETKWVRHLAQISQPQEMKEKRQQYILTAYLFMKGIYTFYFVNVMAQSEWMFFHFSHILYIGILCTVHTYLIQSASVLFDDYRFRVSAPTGSIGKQFLQFSILYLNFCCS